MHELFTKVLSKRDLSRAGDLFSVSDSEIVEYLTEVVSIFYFLILRLLISYLGSIRNDRGASTYVNRLQ